MDEMGLIGALFGRLPILFIIVALGIGGYVFRDYLSGNVVDLRVGDCFDEPAMDASGQAHEVKDVQHQPCAASHDGEVIAIVTHPAGTTAAYPAVKSFERLAVEKCLPEFATYTGRDYRTTPELDLGIFYPTDTGWGKGDRSVTCYAYNTNGTKLARSIRKSPASH